MKNLNNKIRFVVITMIAVCFFPMTLLIIFIGWLMGDDNLIILWRDYKNLYYTAWQSHLMVRR